jgi:hypothetical protein
MDYQGLETEAMNEERCMEMVLNGVEMWTSGERIYRPPVVRMSWSEY